MMMIIQRTCLLLAGAVSLAILPADAAAQRRFGPSVEASLGISAGAGGEYVNRAGGSAEAIVTMPVSATSSHAFVVGLTGAANGPVAGDDICIGKIGGGDEITCLDRYPTFLSLGVVAGVQRPLGARLSSRILAGPAYYHSVEDGDTFGLQGRVDVAAPLALRTALVGSVRGAVLPDFRGETLRIVTFGLGLRIQ